MDYKHEDYGRDVAITLKSSAPGYRDAYGVWHDGEVSEYVATGRKFSSRQSEFFKAGAAGLAATCSVIIAASEYNGETEAVVDGVPMTVYRTYDMGDEIQLYLAERKGS
jgi:hypothetical protein